MENSGADERRLALLAGVIGVVVVGGYAAVGTLQILVWNPQSAVPGMTLEEIRGAMASANESLGTPQVLAWAGTGIVLALLVPVAAQQQGTGLRVRTVVRMDLLLLVLAAPSYWFASFPAGMGIADTFVVSGADHSPWGKLLYLVSAVASLALVFVLLRGRQRPASPVLADP